MTSGKEEGGTDRTLVVLSGEILTPPVSRETRREIGFLIRKLQLGHSLGMPHSRPMPSIGPRCHELRVKDGRQSWRIVYRIDRDAILVAAVFSKKTSKTPNRIIDQVKSLLREYNVKS